MRAEDMNESVVSSMGLFGLIASLDRSLFTHLGSEVILQV